MGDKAASLGAADQFLDGHVGKIEERSLVPLAWPRLLRRCLYLSSHEFPPPTLMPVSSRPQTLSRMSRTAILNQKRGARGGPPLPPAPGTTLGFIGSRPSRCNFLRASLR